MKSKTDVMVAFIESIHALGGRITPIAIHDQAEFTVIVPKQHEAKASELIDQFYADLAAASPS